MEQYLIKRKKNGQFSKKGRVIKVKKQSYWSTFRYDRLFLTVLIITVIIYLLVK